MRSRARRVGITSKALFYAIVIHVVAGLLLVMNIDWPTHVASPRSEPAPVQASVVSEAEIQKQMDAIQQKEQAEQRKQQEAEEKLEQILKQKEAEERRLAEIKERQDREEQKAEELARQKEQEQQELAKLKQQEEEQRKQEEAEAERKRKEEEAERKRQEEAERERKAEEERKRKAEEERQRKAAEEQRQKELAEKREREKQLQEQLEQERVARRVESALGQYIPIIQQKVGRNWNRPAGLRDDIEAHVNVRLSQAGEVISARIVKSSGNPVFDRSVENAVLKASPLPIPQERGVNDQFRNLNLRFRPEDMTL